jgi:PAS domain S-box-containing protein
VRVPLADVIITDELDRRPSRPPDYQAENRALAALADALAETPETILRTLADTALELCSAHTAGISILDSTGPSPLCRWHAVSGRLAGLAGSGMPCDSSPCAPVLELGSSQLFAAPERHFDYGIEVHPPIVEALVIPFFLDNKLVGTLWIISHSPERRFDAEDQRLLARLSRFASGAYQMTLARRAAEVGRAELERRVEERTAALRAGELRYRRLIEGNIIGVLSISGDGRVTDANDAFLDMVGYARDDVAAGRLTWQDITPPEGLIDEYEHSRQHPPRDGRLPAYRKEFLHRNGGRIPALVGGTFLEGNGGEAIYFVLDIADRRQQELDDAFLNNLDMTLHHLVDVDDVCNTVAMALGDYLQARCVMTQVRAEPGERVVQSIWTGIGKPDGHVYPMNDYVTEEFQEALLRGDIGVVYDVWTDPRTFGHAKNYAAAGVGAFVAVPWLHEGRWRACLTLLSPGPRVWTEHESSLARQVAARVWPLIEHARALRALRDSEVRLRLFIDQAPAAIAMLDRDMRYLAVSRRWLADYGMVGQDLIGVSYYDTFPELPAGWREIHRRALAGEVLKSEEDWFLRADGILGWLKWEVRPWHSNDGGIGGIVIFTENISERKKAEAALRTLNETLEQRIAERTSESELRAAQLRRLAAEVTEAEQRERRQLASILHDHLQQILVSARMHLQSVTSRLTEGELKQILEKTDLLLDDCITESQSLSHQLSPPILNKLGLLPALAWLADEQQEKHDLVVAMRCDRAVEPADPVVRTILFHAVRELLFNIVKHARVKQAEILVTSINQRIRIEVRDSGIGFDPSSAGEKPNALGLHSIRERLRLFGGELDVVATPGKGAKVILHAPLDHASLGPSEDPSTRATGSGRSFAASSIPHSLNVTSVSPGGVVKEFPAAPPEAEPAPGARPRTRILLVDDHPLMRSVLAEMLAPYSEIDVVGEAGDGAEALSAAVRLNPDLILMDVSMPHLNGIEATRRILTVMPETRVVGLSLHETESMAQAMREAGAVDYFRKNEPAAVLLEKILRHVKV